MKFRKILKENDFSCTESRLCLLDVLLTAEFPLSEKELESRLPEKYNRTTIYRNLNALSEKGIIQRILSGESVKFKLSSAQLNNRKDPDHIHFQCRICNRIICLEELTVKDYNLPKGFQKIENQFLIIGICGNCNEKQ